MAKVGSYRIQIEDLDFAYSKKTPLFQNFRLQVDENQICYVLGQNGSGKTTLMNLIAGQLPTSKGRIQIANSQGEKHLNVIRAYSAVKEHQFFSHLNGLENLQCFQKLFSIADEKMKLQREAWNQLGTFRRALLEPYRQCSTGMRKVLSLYRSFLLGDGLLLWDEPLSGLDSETRIKLLELLKTNFKIKPFTALISTHEISDFAGLPGSIVQLGSNS